MNRSDMVFSDLAIGLSSLVFADSLEHVGDALW